VINVRKGLICSAASLILATAAMPAFAQSAGTWTMGVGVHQVDPKSDSGVDGLDVDSSVRPTITGEYFVADNLGIEVLAALPFEHDITVGGATVGSTKQLPPTVSLQYHFNSAGTVSPFIGAGLNYTTFFSEDTEGALQGAKLKLDDSWGLAAHAGLDFAVGEKAAIRVDVRWIDIDSDASVNGAKLGTVEIDPLVYGASYVFKF
jgi:outer membrane protein